MLLFRVLITVMLCRLLHAGRLIDHGAARATPAPFHTIHSDRLPCLQNLPAKSGQGGPNACPYNATTGGVCPCYTSSNSFGAVEVLHASREGDCNSSSYPTKCLTPVQRVAESLRDVPAGQRAISWLALYLPRVVNGKMETSSPQALWDLDDAGNTMPWADEWESTLAQRVGQWFADYKAASGPRIDMVFFDLESLIFGFGHHFGKGANNTAVYSPWMADPRWPRLLKELNEHGRPYHVSFDDMATAANSSCCGSEACLPGCDTTDFHPYVWNAVMSERIAKMLNASVYQSIAKHFPDVEVSNYDQSHYSSEPKYWAGHLNSYVAPPIGTGWHIGTHSSKSFYCGDAATTQLSITAPYMTVNRTASPFGMLLLHTRQIRSIARQGTPVMPWLEPRESNWTLSKRSLMHGSDMYQEVILHLAMAGVRRFLWWRDSHELPLTKGIEIANCVVAEADKLIGDSARTAMSLDDTVSLEDGYVLSSMQLGNGTVVHRFTPSDEQPIPAVQIVATQPSATFSVAGHTVTPVPRGRLLAMEQTCATSGYWIISA